MMRAWRPRLHLLIPLAAAAVTVAIWFPVLTGERVLIGADLLYQFTPWAEEAHARDPINPFVGDPVTQFLPWLSLVREQFLEGALPVWNPFAFGGGVLLANDQSAPFSPFTLLALPFVPKVGLSIAMLAKLWVAGVGTALFVRALGARWGAASVAGVAYATSSFMVVWLAYPHTGVAALFPWVFWATERLLSTRSHRWAAAAGLFVGLQFLAGHAETSLHLGAAIGVYALVRLFFLGSWWRRAVGALVAVAALGVLISAVQLLPFVEELEEAAIVSDRSDELAGLKHLEPDLLQTWLTPNYWGSPGLEGGSRVQPLYPEAIGFAGVATLVLAAVGAVVAVWRRHPGGLALVTATVLVATVVYGLTTPVFGRAPLLVLANSVRFLVVLSFGVAVLAGIGLDAVLAWRPERPSWLAATPTVLVGSAAAIAAAGAAALVVVDGAGAYDVVGESRQFWTALSAVAALGAVALIVTVFTVGARRLALVGMATLVMAEGVAFAFPYNPRLPADEVPPRSEAVEWLRDEGSDERVAALGFDLIPTMSTLYRISDIRGIDTVIDKRVRVFWTAADPKYSDELFYTLLGAPDPAWLAAAGVTLVMTPGNVVFEGTDAVLYGERYRISRVRNPRPYAYATANPVPVRNPRAAARVMDEQGPRQVDPVEARAPLGDADATVDVIEREPGRTVLDVVAKGPATVVVLESYDDGWRATVDGRRTEVHAANVLFQAVRVPAGRSRVVLAYEPPSVSAGVALTIIGLVLVLALLVWPTRRGEHYA